MWGPPTIRSPATCFPHHIWFRYNPYSPRLRSSTTARPLCFCLTSSLFVTSHSSSIISRWTRCSRSKTCGKTTRKVSTQSLSSRKTWTTLVASDYSKKLSFHIDFRPETLSNPYAHCRFPVTLQGEFLHAIAFLIALLIIFQYNTLHILQDGYQQWPSVGGCQYLLAGCYSTRSTTFNYHLNQCSTGRSSPRRSSITHLCHE